MLLPKDKYLDYIKLRDSDITPSWEINSIGENKYDAVTPNRFSILLTNEVNKKFNINETPQYQSTMLWYHSLAWLRVIHRDHNDDTFVNEFIQAYYNFIKSQDSEDIFSTLTSRDHLVAEQIKNLTYLLAQDETKFNNKPEATKIILSLVKWAILPGNIVNNNHGMMLASALLHIPLFIKAPELRESTIIELASNRLIEIVESAFDSYGLCNENTPAYQHFYIRFLRQQIDELRFFAEYDSQYSVVTDNLSKILKIAEHTLSLIALPNGELPPFGDSNISSQKPVEPLEFAEFYSLESGFYSLKHRKLRDRYFSMKCGYSSSTHKHSDDTSIFYWYDGTPIITDAGFLNYDWRDASNVLVKSQRGHSGAFYDKYDDFYPITLYQDGSNKSRVSSEIFVEKLEDNLTLIKGEVCIDKKYFIKRIVKFSHLNNILISDHFTNDDPNERLEKVVRFLIPSEHDIELFEGYILISNKKFKLKLVYKTGVASIISGEEKDGVPYGGWVVNTPFKDLKECNTVEIRLNSDQNFLVTNLLLEEIE
ncbi:heparinase II/III family protein [Psychrobacter sp. Rd 27.2]|uniref:heparinase II/III family protein n=1 Tax=Psychrobacter sp. Rd 27.2 TaxID=1926479 RepID=UPI000946D913|nr:heparinase II/III family protein [Psychrobacter sp. Rd 27.2]OLF40171.1 hypothetical protein BTV99_09640 [Psychrobacter sp. Rd 27.2]